jgi:hypothetical protein
LADTIKQEILRKAAHLMGIDELATALKSPRHLVEAWMRGHASMPDRKLLILADVMEKFGRPEKG